MITALCSVSGTAANVLSLICFIASFVLTITLLTVLQDKLPRDGGRAFAVNGEKSKGKPRGAGIIFILVFTVVSALFLAIDLELIIYLTMLTAAMLTGFLDDASETPWGELKKGVLDFLIAVICTLTYLYYNGSSLTIMGLNKTVTLHPVLFGILSIILIWTAINVVNCTDGVDGLSASIALISLLSFYVVFIKTAKGSLYSSLILTFLLSLMGYLWFNASPSKLLMGDAGSRAIGLFFALISLKSGAPLLFLPLCLVFILDGGLGLLKVSLLRFLKIRIMKTIRTPLHDHARKNKGWSDTQTVFRFTILQAACSLITLGLLFYL